MKKDLEKLRSLRKNKKPQAAIQFGVPKQNPNKNKKTGIEFYQKSLTLLDPESIFERTSNFLQKKCEWFYMSEEKPTLLANQYMQNYGGCPFTGLGL